jgi:hypothetical protein
MASQHPKTRRPTDKDLRENPGIGTSKGTAGRGDVPDGENTFEGDVENDVTRQGGVNPNQTGRTNK